MKISSLNSVKFNTIPKLQSANNNNKINFAGGVDTVHFSKESKEKGEIVKELINAGYTPQEASYMLKFYKNNDINLNAVNSLSADDIEKLKFENTEMYRTGFDRLKNTPINYDTLVNGDKNGKPIHLIQQVLPVYDNYYGQKVHVGYYTDDLDRNLTPTEAVIYLAENMHHYYLQNKAELDCGDWNNNNMNLSPLKLAEYMNQGLNVETAGAVEKGIINLEDAKEVMKYFPSDSVWQGQSYERRFLDENNNVITVKVDAVRTYDQVGLFRKEGMFERIVDNLDTIKEYTSDEKNEDGTYKSGLIRPLTNEEIITMIYDFSGDYIPWDVDNLNNYIEQNQINGCNMYEVNYLY